MMIVNGVDEYANSSALLTKSSKTTTYGQAGKYEAAMAAANYQ
jgi:hypothetical protein